MDFIAKLKLVAILILSIWSTHSLPVVARPKALEGPIPAFVERVVDGDTLVVRARIWLGQELRVMVRVNGIDAPEIRSRCPKEHELAVSARRFVKRLVGQRKVSLSRIRQGKYAGRVIAEVTVPNGSLLSARLLKANLARPYKRGRRKSWCRQTTANSYKKAQINSSRKSVAPLHQN